MCILLFVETSASRFITAMFRRGRDVRTPKSMTAKQRLTPPHCRQARVPWTTCRLMVLVAEVSTL